MRLTTVVVCLTTLPHGTRAFLRVQSRLATAKTLGPSARTRHVRPRMGLDVLASELGHLLHPAHQHPHDLMSIYKQMAETNGFAVDAATTSVIYGASQGVASLSQRVAPQLDRWARFVVFGFIDGTAGHWWYHTVNEAIAGTSIREVACKMAADATFYTPTYCLSFLALITLAEGKGFSGVVERLRTDYKKMVLGTWLLMAPCNAVIYGVVPLEYQVLASCCVMFCYTVVLALWESTGRSSGALGCHGHSHNAEKDSEKGSAADNGGAAAFVLE